MKCAVKSESTFGKLRKSYMRNGPRIIKHSSISFEPFLTNKKKYSRIQSNILLSSSSHQFAPLFAAYFSGALAVLNVWHWQAEQALAEIERKFHRITSGSRIPPSQAIMMKVERPAARGIWAGTIIWRAPASLLRRRFWPQTRIIAWRGAAKPLDISTPCHKCVRRLNKNAHTRLKCVHF